MGGMEEQRDLKGKHHASFGLAFGFTVLASLMCPSPALARPIKTPRVDWARDDAQGKPTTILRNTKRRASILLSIEDNTPESTTINALIDTVASGQKHRLVREWSQEQLDRASVQRGFSFVLDNGQRGVFAIVWRKTRDGKISSAAYATTDLTQPATSQADFLMVRSFSNQLRRGAMPGRPVMVDAITIPEIALVPPPPKPPVAVDVPDQTSPSAAEAMIVQTALSGPQVTVTAAVSPTAATVPIPSQPPIISPVTPKIAAVTAPVAEPVIAPTAALPSTIDLTPAKIAVTPKAITDPLPTAVPAVQNIARPLARPSYPYTATPGASVGAKPTQISAIIYTPLEFSEVYVLFKDGSFHENIPVALEDWNIGASRKGDPDSWGKWSKKGSETDYELRYSADDSVTITGTKIAPTPSSFTLNGTFAPDEPTQTTVAAKAGPRSTIAFQGNRFTRPTPNGNVAGAYQISGYTMTLKHDSGEEEHLPFFVIPPEDGDTDSLIWLGNAVQVKQEDDIEEPQISSARP
jgi:hypothetical protein